MKHEIQNEVCLGRSVVEGIAFFVTSQQLGLTGELQYTDLSMLP